MNYLECRAKLVTINRSVLHLIVFYDFNHTSDESICLTLYREVDGLSLCVRSNVEVLVGDVREQTTTTKYRGEVS